MPVQTTVIQTTVSLKVYTYIQHWHNTLAVKHIAQRVGMPARAWINYCRYWCSDWLQTRLFHFHPCVDFLHEALTMGTMPWNADPGSFMNYIPLCCELNAIAERSTAINVAAPLNGEHHLFFPGFCSAHLRSPIARISRLNRSTYPDWWIPWNEGKPRSSKTGYARASRRWIQNRIIVQFAISLVLFRYLTWKRGF